MAFRTVASTKSVRVSPCLSTDSSSARNWLDADLGYDGRLHQASVLRLRYARNDRPGFRLAFDRTAALLADDACFGPRRLQRHSQASTAAAEIGSGPGREHGGLPVANPKTTDVRRPARRRRPGLRHAPCTGGLLRPPWHMGAGRAPVPRAELHRQGGGHLAGLHAADAGSAGLAAADAVRTGGGRSHGGHAPAGGPGPCAGALGARPAASRQPDAGRRAAAGAPTAGRAACRRPARLLGARGRRRSGASHRCRRPDRTLATLRALGLDHRRHRAHRRPAAGPLAADGLGGQHRGAGAADRRLPVPELLPRDGRRPARDAPPPARDGRRRPDHRAARLGPGRERATDARAGPHAGIAAQHGAARAHLQRPHRRGQRPDGQRCGRAVGPYRTCGGSARTVCRVDGAHRRHRHRAAPRTPRRPRAWPGTTPPSPKTAAA